VKDENSFSQFLWKNCGNMPSFFGKFKKIVEDTTVCTKSRHASILFIMNKL